MQSDHEALQRAIRAAPAHLGLFNRFHTIVWVRMADPGLTSLPLLLIDGAGYSLLVLKYVAHLALRGARTSRLNTVTKTIGHFVEYWTTKVRTSEGKAVSSTQNILNEFLAAREQGTLAGSADSLGLFWKAATAKEAKVESKVLRGFVAYCKSLPTFDPENSTDATLQSLIVQARPLTEVQLFGIRPARGMLSHLQVAKRGQNSCPPKSKTKTRTHKAFPKDRIERLLAATASVRDCSLYVLQAFGGPRISEAVNLFWDDIKCLEGRTRIRLAHPSQAKYRWTDSLGFRRTGTRKEYLEQVFGIQPRNELNPNHPLYAGWKGMFYTREDDHEVVWGHHDSTTTEVIWLTPEASDLFWLLHEKYTKLRLLCSGNHPYYYINIRAGQGAGEPLQVANAQRAFGRAAKRAGSVVTNIHSLRHFFGEYSEAVLGLNLEDRRQMMRHVDSASTEIYSQPSPAKIRDAIATYHRSAKSTTVLAKVMSTYA